MEEAASLLWQELRCLHYDLYLWCWGTWEDTAPTQSPLLYIGPSGMVAPRVSKMAIIIATG